MKLVFEKGMEGRHLSLLPPCDVPAAEIDGSMKRAAKPRLPQMSENEISRHYTCLLYTSHPLPVPWLPGGHGAHRRKLQGAGDGRGGGGARTARRCRGRKAPLLQEILIQI